MAVFVGCQVVFELSTAVKFKEKQKLRKLVTENGGVVSFIVTKKSTHVVCDDPEKADTSYKCRMAMKYGIPVVSPNYLQRSKDTGILQRTDDFIMAGKSKSETLSEGKITASKYQKTDKKKAVKPFINVSGFKVWNETDKNCPEFISDYQVAKFAVFQSQKKEKNKTVRSFVVIEVHVDDSFVPNIVPGLKHKYRVASHSCVLELIEKGEDGLMEYRFCATVDEALAIYSHLYNLQQQKGMEVMYNVLFRHIGSDKFRQMMSELGLENTDISQPVKDLVQHIWREAQGELDDIISETVTNTEQVDKAEAILKQIKSALDSDDKSKVSKLMADFYGTIPHHRSKQDMSCSKMWLSRKQDLCQLIRDMLSVSEATDWSTTSSTQSKYKALRCVIEYLARNSLEFQQMENLVTQSVIGNTKPTIQNIFAVSRPVESVQYTSYLASTQLFHATKAENLVGILSRGLLLPRVVVDDHGGKRTDPGMLGAGIYFANSASTNIKYSHPSDTKGTRFMLINEVALGKTMQMYEKDTTLNSAPEGYQSVHGVRSNDGRKSAFQDDEFVIYNTSQQRMNYLVEFSLPDDKVKDTADDLNVIEDLDLFLNNDMIGLEDISLNDVTNVTDPMSKVKAGLVSKSDAPVNLKAVHIRAKLLDLASEVVVLQEYENNSKTALEAKYVFPLGDLAAVCGFEAFINGKHIVGEVKEKEKAHKEYKKAISEGHGAYLMDQDEETPDIFTVSVGNLPPGACVLIKITYVAELQVEGELINFQLPGSVAPWKKQSLKEVTQHETETHEVKQGETSVQIAVDMPFDIRTIECPSHQIKVKRTLTKATVEMLENQSIADGFQLLIGLAEIHVPRMWVERKDGEPNHQACMLSFYPEFEACEVDDVNVVLLLDMSNSMKGDNLSNTKKIALLTLQHLPSSWNFNIVVFGTAFKELFPGCVKKTPANVKSASDFIRGLTATMGNTEVIRPMHTFYLLKPESMVQNVFLISDGHINNEEIMMKKAFENFQHTRIFTMGVGSTANRHLLRALSRVAAGAYEFFDPKAKSKWERKVKSQINKAAQPGLTSVHVDWEQHGADVSAPVQAPRQITALFSGSRQVIYGFVPNCTMATLHANIAGEEVSTLVSTSDLSITSGKILHRLTAKAIINDWEDGVLSADKTDHEIVKMNTKDYIIELSKEYSIVTQFTSFVAIEKRDKDDEKAALDAPSMAELIEKENVDQLQYMGFEETKKTDLDYTHDIEDLLINVRLNFDSKEKQNEFLHQAFKLTEQIKDEQVYSQNRVNLENAFFDWELSEQFDFETEFGFKPKRAVKPPITVCVMTLTGRPINVEIDENSSVGELKAEVEKQEGTPPDEQRLLFEGRQVDDTRTLKDCGIQNLALIHLLVRLRAGGTGPEQQKAIERTGSTVKKASSGLWQVNSVATARAKKLQTVLDQENTVSFNRPVHHSTSKFGAPSSMPPKLASRFARRSAPVAEKITIPSSDDESSSESKVYPEAYFFSKAEEVYDEAECTLGLGGFDLDVEVPIADTLSASMHSLSDEESDIMEEEGGKKVREKGKYVTDGEEDDSDDFPEDSEDEDSDRPVSLDFCIQETDSETEKLDMIFEEECRDAKEVVQMEGDEEEKEEEEEDMAFGLFDDESFTTQSTVLTTLTKKAFESIVGKGENTDTMRISAMEISYGLTEMIEVDKSVEKEVEIFQIEEEKKKKKRKSFNSEPRPIEQLHVAEDLLDTQEVLASNVDKVLERGERLDSLVEKSELLSEKSKAFFRASPLSLEEDLNGGGGKTVTDRERYGAVQDGKDRTATMMGAVPSQKLEEDKSFNQGAILYGREPKSASRLHNVFRSTTNVPMQMFGGMSQSLDQPPSLTSGQTSGKSIFVDMRPTKTSADWREIRHSKTAIFHGFGLRDRAEEMEACEMPPPPPRPAPVSYRHSAKQMDFVGFGFTSAGEQSQQFMFGPPPSSGTAFSGFMTLDGTLGRGAQTAPPPVAPPAPVSLQYKPTSGLDSYISGAGPHISGAGPQLQKFTPAPPPQPAPQRLSVDAPELHFAQQLNSCDVPVPSYPPPPHFLPPPGGPPPASGAPPYPPKGQILVFGGAPPIPQGPPIATGGQPPPPKGPPLASRGLSHAPQGQTIVSYGPPSLPRRHLSASDGPPPPLQGTPLTPCLQPTTMVMSRKDTEEVRLLTELDSDVPLKKSVEKPSKAPTVSWRKERSRSPDVSIDKKSASSRDTLLKSITQARKLKPTAKPKAEKKEHLVKELQSALMCRRKQVEQDIDTPLLDDYEELEDIIKDSLDNKADKPSKTGPITAGSPVLSDYGIGVQVPCIVRGELDLTKKEEILTMIQYSQSKDGFWEIQPGSQLEAFLFIDMSLVEEVLSRAGLRSLGLSVYKDVMRIVSSVIVMLVVIKLYLPDAFPLDFNDPIMEEKVLSDFENAIKASSLGCQMMLLRAYEFRQMIDEKIPLACKMLELGADWTRFVARMMDLHKESEEKGPVLYLHGLECSQRMENPVRA